MLLNYLIGRNQFSMTAQLWQKHCLKDNAQLINENFYSSRTTDRKSVDLVMVSAWSLQKVYRRSLQCQSFLTVSGKAGLLFCSFAEKFSGWTALYFVVSLQHDEQYFFS